jgi:hypothetical protein
MKHLFFIFAGILSAGAVAAQPRDSRSFQEVSLNASTVLQTLPIIASLPDSRFSTAAVYRYHPQDALFNLRIGIGSVFGGSIGLDRIVRFPDERFEFLFGAEYFLLLGRDNIDRIGFSSGFQIPVGFRYQISEHFNIGTEGGFLLGFSLLGANPALRFGMRPASGVLLTYKFIKKTSTER